MTMSSWSWPIEFWPLRASTPMTVQRHLACTRMTWSIGSASPNSCAPRSGRSSPPWPSRPSRPPRRCGRRPAASRAPPGNRAWCRTPDGAPVGVARHHLRAGAQDGRGDLHLGHVDGDGAGVLLGQASARSARPGARRRLVSAPGSTSMMLEPRPFICSSHALSARRRRSRSW